MMQALDSPTPQLSALVVDDDPSVCAVFSRLLTKMGYAVEVANDGERALAIVPSRTFDVCLVDQQLPGVGGVTIARAIRAATPDAVIVFVTAHATTTSADDLVGVADEYLTKPFDLENLRETVVALVAGRNGRRLTQPSPVPTRGVRQKWVHLVCNDDEVSALVTAACSQLGTYLTFGPPLPAEAPDVLVMSAELASFEMRKAVWAFQAKRRSFLVVLITDPTSVGDSTAAVALKATWRITLPAKPEQALLVLSTALR